MRNKWRVTCWSSWERVVRIRLHLRENLWLLLGKMTMTLPLVCKVGALCHCWFKTIFFSNRKIYILQPSLRSRGMVGARQEQGHSHHRYRAACGYWHATGQSVSQLYSNIRYWYWYWFYSTATCHSIPGIPRKVEMEEEQAALHWRSREHLAGRHRNRSLSREFVQATRGRKGQAALRWGESLRQRWLDNPRRWREVEGCHQGRWSWRSGETGLQPQSDNELLLCCWKNSAAGRPIRRQQKTPVPSSPAAAACSSASPPPPCCCSSRHCSPAPPSHPPLSSADREASAAGWEWAGRKDGALGETFSAAFGPSLSLSLSLGLFNYLQLSLSLVLLFSCFQLNFFLQGSSIVLTLSSQLDQYTMNRVGGRGGGGGDFPKILSSFFSSSLWRVFSRFQKQSLCERKTYLLIAHDSQIFSSLEIKTSVGSARSHQAFKSEITNPKITPSLLS